MKKLIAVDLDEVLARHNKRLAEFHNAKYATRLTEEDFVTDDWAKVWGVTQEEAERRAVEFHLAQEHARLEPIKGALDALEILRHKYEFVAITIRRRMVVEISHKWLKEYYPNIFREIHFIHYWDEKDKRSKADVCAEIGAGWLIDDSLQNVTGMARRGGQGLLFGDYAWNKADVLPDRVTRLKNWQEVTEYFDER